MLGGLLGRRRRLLRIRIALRCIIRRRIGWGQFAPRLGRHIEGNLQRDYDTHMKEKATKQWRGKLGEPVMIKVVMATSMSSGLNGLTPFAAV